MTTVNIYLTFDGNCQEAFEHYKSVFGTEFQHISTFGEMPQVEGAPPVSADDKDKIMHVSLPISDETTLMGSDAGGEWGQGLVKGNNFSISVNTDDKGEADRIFNHLGQGGTVTMPMADTFWQAYFGMLTDRFGVQWMINCNLPTHKSFEEDHS